MSKESFAAKEAALAREVLDRTFLELRGLPSGADTEALSLRVHEAQRALAAVRAMRGDPYEHLEHLEWAERELGRLIAVLRRPACGELGAGLARDLEPFHEALKQAREPTIDELAMRPHHVGDGAEPSVFRVSRGVPEIAALSDVPAPLVTLEASTEPFEPPSVDIDQLFEEVRQGRDPDLEAHIDRPPESVAEKQEVVRVKPPRPTMDIDVRGVRGELAQLRRIARDCAESIGALANLRRLEPEEPWDEGLRNFERQILEKLDALFALGVKPPGGGRTLSPIDEVTQYARDGATHDVFRAFARAFVLSCTDSEAAARAAVLEMRQSPIETVAAQSDAFALASGSVVDEVLRSACREETSPEHLAGMLVALRRREGRRSPGRFLSEAVPLLQHADDGVRAEAVRCVAAVVTDEGTTALIQPRLEDTADDVVLAALEALLRVDKRFVRERLRKMLTEDVATPGTLTRNARAGCMRLLALGGAGEDAELLRTAVSEDPRSVRALGWHGHVGHVPLLLELVEGDEPIAEAAEHALYRIAGAKVERDAWKAWWVEHAADWGDERRRLGAPYSVQVVLDELREIGVLTRDREVLAQELSIAGASRSVDVHGWAAAQEADVAALAAETVTRGERSMSLADSVSPGRWLTAIK